MYHRLVVDTFFFCFEQIVPAQYSIQCSDIVMVRPGAKHKGDLATASESCEQVIS